MKYCWKQSFICYLLPIIIENLGKVDFFTPKYCKLIMGRYYWILFLEWWNNHVRVYNTGLFHFMRETKRNLLALMVLELWSNLSISTAHEMYSYRLLFWWGIIFFACVCLFVYLSVCLSICPSICLSVTQSVTVNQFLQEWSLIQGDQLI